MQGHLNKISSKSGQGAKGPWTMYSVEIDGNWYGVGFDKPSMPEGSYVSFDVEQKGNFKNAKNLAVAQGAPAPTVAKPSGGAPVNKKDVSIHFQSCRKDAINTLSVLLEHEAIKLPAKQADKYDAAMALMEELTTQYYLKLESVIEEGGVNIEDAIPAPGDV